MVKRISEGAAVCWWVHERGSVCGCGLVSSSVCVWEREREREREKCASIAFGHFRFLSDTKLNVDAEIREQNEKEERAREVKKTNRNEK